MRGLLCRLPSHAPGSAYCNIVTVVKLLCDKLNKKKKKKAGGVVASLQLGELMLVAGGEAALPPPLTYMFRWLIKLRQELRLELFSFTFTYHWQ
ncbi:hypothetical protein O9992_11210 [Vibrio lentus]|nr:hypothetical protein [Vibrio lentus]